MANSLTEPLDSILKAREGCLSGTLAVIRKDQVYSKGVGLANSDKGLTNTAATVFLIASNTKQFTAAAILKLQEMGRLSVSEPVAVSFPEIPEKNLSGPAGRPATIEDLVHHTSGIVETYWLPEIEARIAVQRTPLQTFLTALHDKSLQWEPGTRYEYSNTGYVLLGEIVKRKSGKSFKDFVESELLRPQKIENIWVGLPPTLKSLARPYIFNSEGRRDYIRDAGLKEPQAWDLTALSDTNVSATATDLGRWLLELVAGHVLNRESTQKMFTPKLNNYGYGFLIEKDRLGRTRYYHNGLFLNYSSFMTVYPQEQVAIVFLGNQHDPLAESQYPGCSAGEFETAITNAVLN